MVKSSEAQPGFEPANEEDLIKLFSDTQQLVRNKGSYHLEPKAIVLGSKEGIPIVDMPPYYLFEVPSEKVRKLSPITAELFQLKGNLQITVWDAHYSSKDHTLSGDDRLSYYEPYVSFYGDELEDPSVSSLDLLIYYDDGRVKTTKSKRTALPTPPSRADIFLQASDFVANIKFAAETGIDQITQNEHDGLRELVDGLMQESS